MKIYKVKLAVAIAAITGNILLVQWCSTETLPPAEVTVPLGRVLCVDRGLANRTFTNVTLCVIRPANNVVIESVTVVCGDSAGLWISPEVEQWVTLRECTFVHGNIQVIFGDLEMFSNYFGFIIP